LFVNDQKEVSMVNTEVIKPPPPIVAAAIGVSGAAARTTRRRIDSIDLLRGIVMVFMLLDHTRDYLHNAALTINPTDPTVTNPWLFFTRWITHFCAPTFVFLAGTGVYLQFARGKDKRELSGFLVKRGLWLIILELTVVRLGAFFNMDPKVLALIQVIWVIGVSMIILAALIHLPLKVIAAFGLSMIALHNLLDRFPVTPFLGPGTPVPSLRGKLWMILHQQAFFPITHYPSPFLLVLYPLIPWIAVMAVGYCFGALYQWHPNDRRRALLWIGGLSCALFVGLRLTNLYGDPFKWSVQPRGAIYTVLSFLNTQKYPPSLLFLLMTLGPAILSLAWFESPESNKTPGGLRGALITFGRVPLFFYLLQWPTAHLIAIVLHWAFGKPVYWLFQTPLDWFTNPPKGNGFNLAVVYAAWLAGVLLLYPLCRWFAGVKERRRDWWLSYL